MSTWRMARSLDVLRAQLDELAPGRSRASDGGIGDAEHASRASDHNPWYVLEGQPLVTARDFTHDPAGGLDCDRLAVALQAAADPRIKYVIWARRIMSGAAGPQPWRWRPYDGANAHEHHLHLSVVADARADSVSAWRLGSATTVQPADGPVRVVQAAVHVVTDGDWGPVTDRAVSLVRDAARGRLHDIADTQHAIGARPDGLWGPQSRAALDSTVRAVQRALGVLADGDWGPKTDEAWRAARAHLDARSVSA